MSSEQVVLISEIFAFLIICFVLYRYVWPIVGRMAGERQDQIQQHVDDAEEATRKLGQAQARFDAAIAEAREEAARIRDDARADAHRLRQELREQADREVERIRARGEEQLAAQRDQTVRQLRAEIGALALERAQRTVVEQLSDQARRSATIDSFLDDLDRMPDREPSASNTSAGGTN